MARISLDIYRAPHQTSLAIGYQLTAVRILTNISLPTQSGWGPYHPAIVDTGAPISMFPMHVWQHGAFTEIGHVMAGGVVQRDECRIPAKLARIECLLSDGKESLGPLLIHAYLAESYQAPTLLGIAGVLESNSLRVNVGKNAAWIESEET